MKKLTAYYLILLYTASIAKPLTVWFADVMAHSCAGHQHLKVVHREGGRDHVHHQMNKAAKDDAPEQKGAAPKPYEEAMVPAFIESLSRIGRFVKSKYLPFNVIQLPSVCLSIQLPPPQAFAA